MRRTNVTISLAVALLVLVAGCSSGSKSSSSSTTAGGGATTTSTGGGPSTTAAGSKTVWLCLPGQAEDPCTHDLSTTVVQPDGSTSELHPEPAADPKVDCFYVYPTVSQQQTPNADLTIDPAETSVAIAQASRFSQTCKVYAPMYRQLTLKAIGGDRGKADPALAYGDVEAAWKDYLAHYNKGRGVVLIGHSQGTFVLTQLVAKQIDADPDARKLLVSALLLGGNVTVPEGKDVGGSFKNVPACRSTDQTGCVVAYSAFLEAPPANTLFGRTTKPGEQVLCVNPAGLGQGNGDLQPYFPTGATLLGGGVDGIDKSIKTPWVAYPSLYKAHCEDRDGASWLQVDDVRKPGDDRAKVTQMLGPTWGLHLVDVNIAYGNLVDLVRSQSAAWKG